MLIGLGGGAASSSASGAGEEALDFASVQRENPEMQRRCQEVIDRCWQLGANNPILSIHDVGAGGLSNALPELVVGAGLGGRIELRAIPCDDPTMSPLEIWCNESQERYVLAIAPGRIADFAALCERERCRWAEVGEATRSRLLEVHDAELDSTPVSRCRCPSCSATSHACTATPFGRRRCEESSTRGGSRSARLWSGCCACRRWRTSRSSSPSAIAPSADSSPAIRWWAPGRCRWPTARSR